MKNKIKYDDSSKRKSKKGKRFKERKKKGGERRRKHGSKGERWRGKSSCEFKLLGSFVSIRRRKTV